MMAKARRLQGRSRPEIEIGSFRFVAGAPTSEGGVQGTPTPQELLAASLAACSTLTMEAYAQRKGWDIGEVVVEVDYQPPERGSPARCGMIVRLSEHVPEEQRQRLMSMAARSPVHRTLEGETMFDERLELTVQEAAANGRRATPPSESNGLLRRLLVRSRAA